MLFHILFQVDWIDFLLSQSKSKTLIVVSQFPEISAGIAWTELPGETLWAKGEATNVIQCLKFQARNNLHDLGGVDKVAIALSGFIWTMVIWGGWAGWMGVEVGALVHGTTVRSSRKCVLKRHFSVHFEFVEVVVTVYWCGWAAVRSMTSQCCYWVRGLSPVWTPWLFGNQLFRIYQQQWEFIKYEIWFWLWCSWNKFKNRYYFSRDYIMNSLWPRFCSESQTIEDFGRELRLQRADVEHLRRSDPCREKKAPKMIANDI